MRRKPGPRRVDCWCHQFRWKEERAVCPPPSFPQSPLKRGLPGITATDSAGSFGFPDQLIGHTDEFPLTSPQRPVGPSQSLRRYSDEYKNTMKVFDDVVKDTNEIAGPREETQKNAAQLKVALPYLPRICIHPPPPPQDSPAFLRRTKKRHGMSETWYRFKHLFDGGDQICLTICIGPPPRAMVRFQKPQSPPL